MAQTSPPPLNLRLQVDHSGMVGRCGARFGILPWTWNSRPLRLCVLEVLSLSFYETGVKNDIAQRWQPGNSLDSPNKQRSILCRYIIQ